MNSAASPSPMPSRPRARTVSPALKNLSGRASPAETALPHGRKIRVAILLFRFAQNRRVKCGNGEENSRPAAFHQFDHAIHFCAFWIQDRACHRRAAGNTSRFPGHRQKQFRRRKTLRPPRDRSSTPRAKPGSLASMSACGAPRFARLRSEV